MSTIPSRSEIPVEQTWDTASIFPSQQAWQEAYESLLAELPGLARFQGRLAESPVVLQEWMEVYQDILTRRDLIGSYARLNYDVDTTNMTNKALADQASTLGSQVAAATAFAEPELIALGFGVLYRWADTEPGLAVYRHYFERLERRAAHVRSAEVEKLFGQLSDPFRSASATHGILINADLTFPPVELPGGEMVELAHSNISQLMTSRERDVRRQAWEKYADAHLAFRHTQANALATGVKQQVFMARARNYSSALEAALGANFIPLEVFHNLIDTFRKNLPTWHRYWELRRRALGLEKLHVYDTRAALTEQMPEVSFSQAADFICAGMAPLGQEYVRALRRGLLEERWVDWRPNRGKRFGAYSSGSKGAHPFILMSFNNDIFGTSTLAHELGHSMHSYYSRGLQPYVYSNYGLFLAEVASNFNQAMVRAYLLDTQSDRDFQIAVIEEAMSNFHRYFFIMPTLARFELAIHERVERGQGLSAKILIDLMADLFAEGYGPQVEMDRERVGSTWMQFSTHLYMNFYVYQYATGISGAHALAQRILTGDDTARQAYLEFLKTGSSRYPLDTLRRAGVDLSSPEPVEQTFSLLADLVDRLDKLVLP